MSIDYSQFAFPKGTPRLAGKDMSKLRDDCWNRDLGRCQACGKRLLKETIWEGHPDRYHMAHKRNKRMHGDSMKQVRALCGECHRAEHGNPTEHTKGLKG